MNKGLIIDYVRIIELLSRFISYVQYMDGKTDYISFCDSAGFLGREEDYKIPIADEARKELRFKEWNESWIGTGRIAACAAKAIGKAGNLINKNQQIDFKNRLNPNHPSFRKYSERVLYEIYRSSQCDESAFFADAIETFGAKYDTIAFLYFIKDYSRFLPISTSHFDKGFGYLNINYQTSYRCSWDNYLGYIGIIAEIRDYMEKVLPMKGTPRLIDAHSFIWIIQQESFQNWDPGNSIDVQIEEAAEKYLQNTVSGRGGYRKVVSNTFIRSAEVVKATKRRAGGICQFCHQPAPFIDLKGEPYLEVHHVKWLSRGGEDNTTNTVALCPNCHTRMHILDRAEDVCKLQSEIEK